METLIKYLNEKFQSFRQNSWVLHSFDFYGYDYGFDLKFDVKTGVWTFKTNEDSGYGPSRVILETKDEHVIMALAECFSPTNDSYKTQRK